VGTPSSLPRRPSTVSHDGNPKAPPPSTLSIDFTIKVIKDQSRRLAFCKLTTKSIIRQVLSQNEKTFFKKLNISSVNETTVETKGILVMALDGTYSNKI
jgi:hypothetical protein